MKKLFFKSMMVIAIASAVVACDTEDDDNNTGSNSSIVGTWDVNSQILNITVTGQGSSSDTTLYANGEYNIVFNTNGKAITNTVDSSGTEIDTLDYTLAGSVLTVIGSNGGAPDTSVLNTSITGNRLVMSQSASEDLGGGLIYSFQMYINCTKR